MWLHPFECKIHVVYICVKKNDVVSSISIENILCDIISNCSLTLVCHESRLNRVVAETIFCCSCWQKKKDIQNPVGDSTMNSSSKESQVFFLFQQEVVNSFKIQDPNLVSTTMF
jgi:hypothetical protein